MEEALNKCEAYEPLLAEVLFGEPGDTEKQLLDDHLTVCSSCAETYRELQGTIDVVSAKTRLEPSPDFWDGFYDRVAERIAGEHHFTQRARFPLSVIWQRLDGALSMTPRWAWQLSAAVALVAVGLVLGRTVFVPGNSENTTFAQGGDKSLVQQAALESRTFEYLGRSKILLLGLVNFDSARDDPATLNLPRRQEIAGDLVREASLLKSDLSGSDHRRLRELISDLELILMQIANIEANYDMPEIEMVQTGVDRKALLFKINVEEMRRIETEFEQPSTDGNARIL